MTPLTIATVLDDQPASAGPPAGRLLEQQRRFRCRPARVILGLRRVAALADPPSARSPNRCVSAPALRCTRSAIALRQMEPAGTGAARLPGAAADRTTGSPAAVDPLPVLPASRRALIAVRGVPGGHGANVGCA